ncbi:hypothetical protein Q7P37_011381 [Cladosporium fusiforme]
MAGIVVRATAIAVHALQEDVSIHAQEKRFDALAGELTSLLEGLASKIGKDTSGGLRTLQSESEAAGLLLARLGPGWVEAKSG